MASRAALWYGFLFALIAAELFAGRVLRRIVMASLDRPSLRELEAMLREPFGDPRAAARVHVSGRAAAGSMATARRSGRIAGAS